MLNSLRLAITILILCLISCLICYWYIDKPVVYFSYVHHFRGYKFLDWFTHIPSCLHLITFILYPILIVRYCYQRTSDLDLIGLAFANSISIAFYLKGLCKVIFGRYWPETFKCNNLSLLHDDVYGFNPFHSGVSYESFPSGHTAVTFAAATILWIVYPGLRGLLALIVALVIIGLLGNYYHFVSDVIAGGVLGFLTAYFTAKWMNLN